MGNICRSPTAQGVFQNLVNKDGLGKKIIVDSAGTVAYHAGKKPDVRAIDAATKRGYDLSKLRARKVMDTDFKKFDYLLAMDSDNHMDLIEQCPEEYQDKVKYFLEYASDRPTLDVPDPYYGGLKGFETVLDLVEEGSKGLLVHIKKEYLK